MIGEVASPIKSTCYVSWGSLPKLMWKLMPAPKYDCFYELGGVLFAGVRIMAALLFGA